MARLADYALGHLGETPPVDDLGIAAEQQWFEEEIMVPHREALARIQSGDTADLTGLRLRWQRGDGYAIYQVVKNRPLTLAPVAYGDAWEVEDALIRGLNKQEIVQQAQREIRLNEIFKR